MIPAIAPSRFFFVPRLRSSLTLRSLIVTLLISLYLASQPVAAGNAVNPNSDVRLQEAVAWATQQLKAPSVWLEDGATLCDKFVENAFGVTAQYPTAYDMYLAIGKSADPAHHTLEGLKQAPAGAIVFFERNTGNGNNGHVGIYTGDGKFIGVVNGGGVKQLGVKWWNDYIAHFLGWAYPRAEWPGSVKGKVPARSVPTTPRPAPPAPSAQALESATREFQGQWQTGEALARNLWGPSMTKPVQEVYDESPGGYRLVQYYDKGRMELTDPKSGTVTNGLLATELITGTMQTGNAAYESRSPAAIPIAGDLTNPGPTYASLSGRAANLLAPASSKTEAAITSTVSSVGDISESPATDKLDVRVVARADTTLTAFDSVTKHNVPTAFAAYRAKVGVGVIGYAKSEPFVTTVKIAGVERQIVVQIFERRVLTYNAANDDAFKVEMGNIGQHYHQWRYGS